MQPCISQVCSLGSSFEDDIARAQVSLELLNPQFWQIPARQVGENGLTALRVALGLAEGHARGKPRG
jgi:hypothetical protein